jgi:hypothetical protein
MGVGMAMDVDHKFEVSSQFKDGYTSLSCEVSQLQPIARAFIRNMNRVRGIGGLPINLLSVGMINEAARVEALFNKGINPGDPRITYGHSQFDPNLFSEVDEERKRLIDKWEKAYPKREDFAAAVAKKATHGMNIIIAENKEEASEAVQATMAAMLTGLWTAFESLAQDTWITAVNLHPDPLAKRVLSPKTDLGTGTQLKSITTDQIVGHDFDLSGSMGIVLFRLRAVDFQQLKTIRLAYKVAFADELEPIFAEYNVELFRLETVRNLFVHKGGLIDRKFVERMGNEVGFKDKIGYSLSVSGEYVADKANVVSVCSNRLIQAVDKWLTVNTGS